TDWLPSDYPAQKDLKVRLPEIILQVLQNLGLPCQVVGEVTGEEAERVRSSIAGLLAPEVHPSGTGKILDVIVTAVLREPYPFKVDLGAPLPTGWLQTNIGLTKKEILGMNAPLVMAHEVVYRTLLQACLHPHQTDVFSHFPAERVGLYLGSGIGPQ